MTYNMTLTGIEGLPEIGEGDDLGRLIVEAAEAQGAGVTDGDVLVVTQKIVSKAEGRVLDLRTVEPSPQAQAFADAWEKDARVVEVALRESVRVVRMENGVLITETRHGFVCANSGVDASNVGRGGGDHVVLLPVDSDASADRIRRAVREIAGVEVAVIVSDTFGRPWREGAGNVAIGAAGIDPLWDYRGESDNDGRELHSTVIAVADEIAAAAELVTNKLTRVPVALVRGYPYRRGESLESAPSFASRRRTCSSSRMRQAAPQALRRDCLVVRRVAERPPVARPAPWSAPAAATTTAAAVEAGRRLIGHGLRPRSRTPTKLFEQLRFVRLDRARLLLQPEESHRERLVLFG